MAKVTTEEISAGLATLRGETPLHFEELSRLTGCGYGELVGWAMSGRCGVRLAAAYRSATREWWTSLPALDRFLGALAAAYESRGWTLFNAGDVEAARGCDAQWRKVLALRDEVGRRVQRHGGRVPEAGPGLGPLAGASRHQLEGLVLGLMGMLCVVTGQNGQNVVSGAA